MTQFGMKASLIIVIIDDIYFCAWIVNIVNNHELLVMNSCKYVVNVSTNLHCMEV